MSGKRGAAGRRGADSLVSALGAAGVRTVFALSGNQIMSVFDASIGAGIELLHVRHEAAAVHMADAWGRLTGRPGVALATAGPGFANTLSAMYVARMAESPLVLLSGDAPRGGVGEFQEMAQAEMSGPVAKASWTAADASTLVSEVAQAFRIAASGRPGPVHLALPVDLLEGEAPDDAGGVDPGDFPPVESRADNAEIRAVVEGMARAKRPLALAGPAMARGEAYAALRAIAEETGIPVVFMESPRGTADPSLGAFADVLPEADAALLLGKKLDFSLKMGRPPTFAPRCRFFQIDSDAAVIEQARRVLTDPTRLDAAAVGSPAGAVGSIAAGLRDLPAVDPGWYNEVEAAVSYRPASWDSVKSGEREPLHPLEVGRAVRDVMSRLGGSVFVSDGGEFGQWAQAAIPIRPRLINGPSGAIGGGAPFALGARAARPGSSVFLTTGDGSFGYHALELDTAARHGLPFVAVVGNDAAWNAEYQIQLREYGEDRLVGCELLPTRYDRLAESLGGHGERVTEASQLRPALERAAASGKPACVNVMIRRTPAPVIELSPQR